MIFREELLKDDYSLKEAEVVQLKFQEIIAIEQETSNINTVGDIKSVVGVDISYYNTGTMEYGVACAVLWNVERGLIEQKAFTQDTVKFPYKPGFLGFRECGLLAKSIIKLSTVPDLIMCDGHGIIHPRNFGEAVQLGYSLDTPCIGVAKNPYIGYSKWKKIERKKGNRVPIWAIKTKSEINVNQNKLLGYAVCLNDRSKPVFISVGYKITIDIAIAICLATSLDHRQPEPLFLADHLSKGEVKKIRSKLKPEYDLRII
ncbi:MAG: endonuclease V [Promethearchaeota archaeon]